MGPSSSYCIPPADPRLHQGCDRCQDPLLIFRLALKPAMDIDLDQQNCSCSRSHMRGMLALFTDRLTERSPVLNQAADVNVTTSSNEDQGRIAIEPPVCRRGPPHASSRLSAVRLLAFWKEGTFLPEWQQDRRAPNDADQCNRIVIM